MDGRNLLQPARFAAMDARRICLIKPSALGDIVQSLPVLAALRKRFRHARISWVVNSAYAPLLRPIRILDEVIEFPRESLRFGSPLSWTKLARLLLQLRRQRFDLAIDLQGLARSGAICWATGASLRIGLRSAREGAWLAYNAVLDDESCTAGAVNRYWQVARSFGVGDMPISFPLDLGLDERAWALDRLAAMPRPILAINAGARWETKRWPPERFAEVAIRSLGRIPGSVVLIGGPTDERIARRVWDAMATQPVSSHPCELESTCSIPRLNLCGQTTLRQLAAILEQCDLVLTNDSGPMHLAAAVGTPTVALFTCTDPNRAAPFGDGHRIIQTSVECRASYLKTCNRLDCMKDISCNRVAEVVASALGEQRTSCADRSDAA